jgi:hypothetical protein
LISPSGYQGTLDRLRRAVDIELLKFPCAPVIVCNWAASKQALPEALVTAFASHPGVAQGAPSNASPREVPHERAARRLARLRELGGDYVEYGSAGKTTGQRGALAKLEREEAAAGRPMNRKADIKHDLLKAIRKSREGA